MSYQEEIDDLQNDLESKTAEIQNFRKEMKTRRVQLELQEQNPFKVPITTCIDKKLAELKKQEQQELKGQAGIVNEDRVKEILRKVDKSLGMDKYFENQSKKQ